MESAYFFRNHLILLSNWLSTSTLLHRHYDTERIFVGEAPTPPTSWREADAHLYLNFRQKCSESYCCSLNRLYLNYTYSSSFHSSRFKYIKSSFVNNSNVADIPF